MSNLSLFDDHGPEATWKLAAKLRQLAAEDVWFGTSSWKYEGWRGQVYTPERYYTRGRFSKRKFLDTCLAEYASTFPIVCGDFSFYQFPSDQYWRRLFTSAPPTLRYAFKVPEDITVKTFPSHARYGGRAGKTNDNFLNVELFRSAFLRPLEPYREQVATLIFEFGAFSRKSCEDVSQFAAGLDRFLAALPRGIRYSVEIRNPEFLAPEYFDCLRAHNVAHVFTGWARMPELGSQITIPRAFTADFTVARALLRRGRQYERAVNLFEPYDRIQEENPKARQAMRELAHRARSNGQPAFIFVNNRLEGNAPGTIEAVAFEL